MATDVAKTIEYPEMDPNEKIFGTGGLAKVLYILYGPNFDIANLQEDPVRRPSPLTARSSILW